MICQTQQNFIMFIIVLRQHVSILTESSSGPSKKTDPYLETLKWAVKHFGMASIKFVASQAKSINLYKNTRSKLLKCWANICFNKKCLVKKSDP